MTESVWPAKHEVFTSDPLQIKFADPLLGGQVCATKENNHRAFHGCRCFPTNVFLDALVKGVSSGFSCECRPHIKNQFQRLSPLSPSFTPCQQSFGISTSLHVGRSLTGKSKFQSTN